jgi:uncharacterized protein YkwD
MFTEHSFPRTGPAPQYLLFSLAFIILAGGNCVLAQSADHRPVARLVGTIEPGATRVSVREAHSSGLAGLQASRVSLTKAEQRAFDLINAQRVATGLRPLILDAQLCQLAKMHSQDMASSNSIGHIGSDGLGTADRARAHGVRGWRALGENIALNQGYSDPEGFAVDHWMQSGAHRGNILNTMFSYSGIGVVRAADGTVYLTQLFMAR